MTSTAPEGVDLPKYVVVDRDRHGNERLYVRRPGDRKRRISAHLGQKDFWSQYRAIISAPLEPPAPRQEASRALKRQPVPRSAYIYVIAGSLAGPVKVGVSQNVKARLRALQISAYYKLRIFHTVQSDDAATVERAAHRLLREGGYAGRGEWFRTTVAQAVSAISRAEAASCGRNIASTETTLIVPPDA